MRGVLRIVAAAAVLLMFGIYYARGLSVQVWPDSFGYLAQAYGIAGFSPYARPLDRSLGYPSFIAFALLTPRPALVLVAMQAILAIAALMAVYRTLTRIVLPRCGIGAAHTSLWKVALLAATATAGLYSGLHVQVAAVLSEILFAALVLAAVLAAMWLMRPDRQTRWPWLEAPAVAAVGAAPLLVKPHWLFAAAGLALLSGFWLWRSVRRPDTSVWLEGLRLGLAAALCAGAAFLTVLPDRWLAERYSPRDHALFGPRSAFCNHAHLVQSSLEYRPGIVLQDDQNFERHFRERLAMLVAEHRSGWKLLGYNGDICTYSRELTSLLSQRFPDFKDESRFLLGSLMNVAIADPLPYARKVVLQTVHGFLTAFDRFAIRTRTGVEPAQRVTAAGYPPPGFFGGMKDAEEVGPLGTKRALKGSLTGRFVQGLLAVIFVIAKLALAVSVLAALALPWRTWRGWSTEDRQAFLSFLALPLGVLFAHHSLVALVHSFDVWRYGFNMFFVNLLFMGSSALFWFGAGGRRRSAR